MTEKILYDSDEAAKIVTVTGWVSHDGRFFGDKEELARYSGCTHKVCECGNEHSKHRTMCDVCADKKDEERYLKVPFKDWDGEPLTLFGDDKYFFGEEDVYAYCENQGITDSTTLQLVICEPKYAWEIDPDEIYHDYLPEGMCVSDVAPEIAEAFEKLNEVIRQKKNALCWMGGKYRTTVKIELEIDE